MKNFKFWIAFSYMCINLSQASTTTSALPSLLSITLPTTIKNYETSALFKELCISFLNQKIRLIQSLSFELLEISLPELQKKLTDELKSFTKLPSLSNIFKYLKAEEKLHQFNLRKHKVSGYKELKSQLINLLKKKQYKQTYSKFNLIITEANAIINQTVHSDNEIKVKQQLLAYIIEIETEIKYMAITNYLKTKQDKQLIDSMSNYSSSEVKTEVNSLFNNLPLTHFDYTQSKYLMSLVNYTPIPLDSRNQDIQTWINIVQQCSGPSLKAFLLKSSKMTHKITKNKKMAYLQYKGILTKLLARNAFQSSENVHKLEIMLLNVILKYKKARQSKIVIPKALSRITKESFESIRKISDIKKYTIALILYITVLEIELKYLDVTNNLNKS